MSFDTHKQVIEIMKDTLGMIFWYRFNTPGDDENRKSLKGKRIVGLCRMAYFIDYSLYEEETELYDHCAKASHKLLLNALKIKTKVSSLIKKWTGKSEFNYTKANLDEYIFREKIDFEIESKEMFFGKQDCGDDFVEENEKNFGTS